MAKDPIRSIENILVEADTLIRLRLKATGLEAHHVILAMRPDGIGIVRSNAGLGGRGRTASRARAPTLSFS